ncbi:MAG: GNAT family N-acetyltransferase [Saprospirales bacterium]|nr:MAG: GNAT family N-acetyltransferase [Saprospirales bacterium]
MQIKHLYEHYLDEELRRDIAELLSESFDGYPKGRVFFHQIPALRILAFQGDTLTGHLAIDHRIIHSGGVNFNIFGIVDLCVGKGYREAGLASGMLKYLHDLAKKSSIDFLMLVSGANEFYLNRGFSIANNVCCWMMVQNNRSIGLVRRKLEEGLMYKAVGDKVWPETEIDLLGHIF